MSGINSQKVYLPSPDQTPTTGAVATAPVGTTAPADARAKLASPWDSGGYVGQDGVSLSISKSYKTIKDWSQSVVRKALSEFDATMKFPWLQVDDFAMEHTFGKDNVNTKPATSSAGNQMSVGIGADTPGVKAWCFSMKDEGRRVRIYVPRGEVTEVAEVPFKPSDDHLYNVTLSTYDDGTGHSIYVMYDDGEVIAG